jgi:hypothetical protein
MVSWCAPWACPLSLLKSPPLSPSPALNQHRRPLISAANPWPSHTSLSSTHSPPSAPSPTLAATRFARWEIHEQARHGDSNIAGWDLLLWSGSPLAPDLVGVSFFSWFSVIWCRNKSIEVMHSIFVLWTLAKDSYNWSWEWVKNLQLLKLIQCCRGNFDFRRNDISNLMFVWDVGFNSENLPTYFICRDYGKVTLIPKSTFFFSLSL